MSWGAIGAAAVGVVGSAIMNKNGGSSGGSSQGGGQQLPAAPLPGFQELQTTGYGGMGYNLPQNPLGMGSSYTGQGLSAPYWANNWFGTPWWGQQAPNVGAALLQQQGWGPWGEPEPLSVVPSSLQPPEEEEKNKLFSRVKDYMSNLRTGYDFDTGGMTSMFYDD